MELTADQMEAMLTGQENRWWSIKIQSLGSKEHFLRYAGPSAVAPGVAHVTAVFQGVTSNAALVSVQAQVAIITSSLLPNGTQNQPYSFVMQANAFRARRR